MYTETLENFNNQNETNLNYMSDENDITNNSDENLSLTFTEPVIPTNNYYDNKKNDENYACYYDTDDHMFNDINNNIEDTQNTLRDNLGRLYNRGDKLDYIKQTTENLIQGATDFKNKSYTLKREMWKKYIFHIISILIIIALILTIVMILIKK